MVFGSIISSPRGNLSLHQILEVANAYLENARNATNPTVALVFCHDTEVSLSQVKKAAKSINDKPTREVVASVYIGLGQVLDTQGHREEAQAFYKKSEKWGARAQGPGQPSHSRTASIAQSTKSAPQSAADTSVTQSPRPNPVSPHKQGGVAAIVPQNVFPRNMRPPVIEFDPPEPDAHLTRTSQLASCLGLLRASIEPEDVIVPAARKWLQVTQGDPDEQERLKTLSTDVIRAFKRDEFKDSKAVTEVAYLAPVLDKGDFRHLVKEFSSGIEHSTLLDVDQLEGLSRLMQAADPGYLDPDDLVKVLELLSTRLQGTHQQSTQNVYQLTLAVSHVLDAMADTEVKGLDREKLHEPLLSYLDGLKGSPDPYLVYQAAYAFQALLCVPDNESPWKATLRRTKKVIKGVSGLVSAVKGLDLNGFIEGLENIQQGLAGASAMIQIAKDAYEGASALAQGGKGFLECMKEGLCFNHKCAWYTALRGADTMIQEGQYAEFRKLVCEAPCRRDIAFQWGVCQRLGDIAANQACDPETRRGAVLFLSEIYKDDSQWGQHVSVKQWILNILMLLSSGSNVDTQFIETTFFELQNIGDASKQKLYQTIQESGPGAHPFKFGLPEIGFPSLLDRVQERLDVEGNVRQLRRQRLKEQGSAVYIPPQAKANLQARDEECFPLMEKVDEFLDNEKAVFLLLGDSGAGKSTFNQQLEYHLWESYKKNTGVIPLYINLPTIDKPEHDMIAKQLRKYEFTEPQIRELKNRTFTLICDGYDESQQTHNLFVSNRLNQEGEWSVKMVISCRSEYVGVDYRDRFQPVDRNRKSESSLFQEAVMIPFSPSQVNDYIHRYVTVHRPLWKASEYIKALDHIPSLKELVRNPFLMSLSLDVLPRIVDPRYDLSSTQITRVALYDQFMEHWLERGKKRLSEKNLSPQARAAFESLIDEGFTRNGITYLKRLSTAIYKEQDGQPVISYSRYQDENSWKAEFFNREDEKQLLREASPLIRSGYQHRFIHRSLLEYGVALAIFDPRELKEKRQPEPSLARRGSASSALSFIRQNPVATLSGEDEQEQDLDSPLVWRSFVNDLSVIQFLEERVPQEPRLKKKLLEYIERSKVDMKWRTAAANAITVLVRAWVQFNHADLRGIRIPGADISYGVFESAQLQEADLRQVNFRGAWLRNADFTNARMTEARFGELPYLKQSSDVSQCAYSPDGTTISVSLYTRTISVYSTSTGDEQCTLTGHTNSITSIIYSPTSDRLASGSYDSTVRLWNINTGKCLHILRGHTGWVHSVSYSPGGDQLASAGHDSTVKLWDTESGQCLHTLTGHTDGVFCVIYSPDGSRIASGSKDRSVRLWDVETKESLHILSGHENTIMKIAFSPQSDLLASASNDTTVRLWDATTGECRFIITDQVRDYPLVVFSPKGDQLATADNTNSAQLWDVNQGACLRKLVGHNLAIRSIAYSLRGDLVVTGSNDTTVKLWDPESGHLLQKLNGHSSPAINVAVSPNGNQVVSAGDDKTVRLWDVEAQGVRSLSNNRKIPASSVKFSPNGGQLATSCSDFTVRLWNMESGSCIRTMTGHTDHIHGIAYSPLGDHLVSASSDMTMKLWDLDTGVCDHTFTGHTGWVRCVAFSPDGSQIASGCENSTICLWNVETKECCQIIIGHSDTVWHVVYSPQGNLLGSASEDGTVRLWDVATGESRCTITGHNSAIRSVMFSPNNTQIATGSMDESIRLWDIETGTCLLTLTGHDAEIYDMLYLPRGDLLVSAAEDETIRIWDVTSGQCRAVICLTQRPLRKIDWIETPDGLHLVACDQFGTVGVWQLINGDQYQLRLQWRSTESYLYADGAIIQGVQGLSQLNKKLLRQHRVKGEPVTRRLHDTAKKVISMAAVVSNLKNLSAEAVQLPSTKPIVSMEQLEQRAAKDPLIRSILDALVQSTHGNE